ncbi:tRNA (adenosine(37)-N6)-dimethylallyltransferase MiaA [Parvibaculaceae bacterium PLY_AMNH_Bact1]|nr:tRNA (adenosine(37)-N6)-dimethylallyltransferase MiaA [Parvibaculaceae bacterium PLY_AMNH_Bact1]
MSHTSRDGNDPLAVLIAGPTASGKSALGLALADRLDGEIINADSMQVYGDLRIVTARPSAEEEGQAPHHLYGHVSADRVYSTGQWLTDVITVTRQVQAQGKVPIVLGGTGLYFRALTEGFVEIPDIPDDVRTATRAEVDEIGPVAAHGRLQEVDPDWAAQVHENDPQRIARGLEVFRATGRPLTAWQAEPVEAPDLGPVAKFVLEPDRDWLIDRIHRRFRLMVELGAVDEVEALLKLGLAPSLPAMKALGVPELGAYLAGNMLLDEAIEAAAIKSRQYAKRQSTWFRQQMISWNRVSAQDLESQIDKIFSFIDE